jgi:Reverse transcriptase (RNA-dependent DNA polymerase)
MDIVGPISPTDCHGHRYILTIVDDSTKFLHIALLQTKDAISVLNAVKEYVSFAERAHNSKIIAVRSDQGSEFICSEVSGYFESVGITQQFANVETPQQNGNVERVNRTLLEKLRTILCHSGLPLALWGELALTATLLYNCTPHSAVRFKTPADLFLTHQSLRRRLASIETLRVVGCKVVAHYTPRMARKASKLDAKAAPAYFIGYGLTEPGYKLWYPGSGHIDTLTGVQFFEEELYRTSDLYNQEDSSLRLVADAYLSVNRLSSNGETLSTTEVEELETWAANVTACGVDTDAPGRDDPSSYAEAMRSTYADKWRTAIEDELSMLSSNGTWEVVPRPPNVNIVGSKWVFRLKRFPDGSVDKFKARLVAQGFSQVPGVDFDATYAPTISRISLRVFMFIASHLQMLVHQMDAKSAFLQGTLDRDIYVSQPPHFAAEGTTHQSHVCKLQKALYGLRQSPLVWNQLLTTSLKSGGFVQMRNEPCLFTRRGGEGLVILAVYVDDITIAAQNEKGINFAKELLTSHFEMVDLGEVKNVLGLTVQRDKETGGFSLNQEHYVQKLVERTQLDKSYPYKIPMEVGVLVKASGPNDKRANPTDYRSIVGGLLYAATLTRPDITYATNVVSRYMAEPNMTHLKVAKRIVQYLKGKSSLPLRYRHTSDKVTITVYSDADFAGDKDARKSTTGYIVLLNNQPVSWRSAKQTCVSTSTVEAEYVAAAVASKEAVWIRNLIEEVLQSRCEPQIQLFVDNEGAKSLAEAEMIKTLTKHIDVSYHYVRECSRRGDIKIISCDTSENLADMFTKPMCDTKLKKFMELLENAGGTYVKGTQ